MDASHTSAPRRTARGADAGGGLAGGPDHEPEAWKRAVAELDEVGKALEARIRELREEQLSDGVPGEEYNVYFMLHGVVQHNLYHAGQIAVLRK